MTKTIDQVRQFHEAFGVQIKDSPHISDRKLNQLRINLLQEELLELANALAAEDAESVLDALADLQYVLDGAYLSLGFHPWKDAASAEVHRSNMSKLQDGKPVLRADGKILKGPNYSPPNLKAILDTTAQTRADKSDGWIEWKGGECPVAAGARVLPKLRGGHVFSVPFEADSFEWKHYGRDADIIAYRLAQ